MSLSEKSIERLFPFIKRARTLIVGQHILLRSKSQLHFILLTTDISDRGKSETLRKFKHYPIVQRYKSKDIEAFFDLRGAKVIGFRKSGLSKSLYAELKPFRINEPVAKQKETNEEPPASNPSSGESRGSRNTPARPRPKTRSARQSTRVSSRASFPRKRSAKKRSNPER